MADNVSPDLTMYVLSDAGSGAVPVIICFEIIKELQSELAIERLYSREQSDKLVQLADQSQQLQLAQFTERKLLNTCNGESSKMGLMSRLFKKQRHK